MKLTELKIKNFKLDPSKKKQSITDGDGLRLEVNKSSKSFVYRKTIKGKDFSFHLGTYPTISLKKARILKDKLKMDIYQNGILPIYQNYTGRMFLLNKQGLK